MTKPGFFRHLFAIVYDLILLIAVLFFATGLLLPFNGGEAFTHDQIFYLVYLLTVSFLFYGWFWTHGGQTLGLKAWEIRLLSDNLKPVTWYQALIRFMVSILSSGLFGIGFFWIFVDKNHRCWHDIVSKTRLFRVSEDQ